MIIRTHLDDREIYAGAFGIFKCFIDAYFMGTGDFGVSGYFENHRFKVFFWIIFLFLTYISLLIILNMVILD